MAGTTIAVTDVTFEEQVLRAGKPVLVDFWAAWCPPCRAIAPTLEELATEYADRVVIAKVNVDENPRAAAEYGITHLPTLVAFKDGQLVERIQGARPKSSYRAYLDSLSGTEVALVE